MTPVCLADYHNGTTLLSKEDLISGMEQPYDMTADGVVIWGSSARLNDPTFLTVRTYTYLGLCEGQHFILQSYISIMHNASRVVYGSLSCYVAVIS